MTWSQNSTHPKSKLKSIFLFVKEINESPRKTSFHSRRDITAPITANHSKRANMIKPLEHKSSCYGLLNFKLNDQSCHVWYPTGACFSITCSRLDASNGNLPSCRLIQVPWLQQWHPYCTIHRIYQPDTQWTRPHINCLGILPICSKYPWYSWKFDTDNNANWVVSFCLVLLIFQTTMSDKSVKDTLQVKFYFWFLPPKQSWFFLFLEQCRPWYIHNIELGNGGYQGINARYK